MKAIVRHVLIYFSALLALQVTIFTTGHVRVAVQAAIILESLQVVSSFARVNYVFELRIIIIIK